MALLTYNLCPESLPNQSMLEIEYISGDTMYGRRRMYGVRDGGVGGWWPLVPLPTAQCQELRLPSANWSLKGGEMGNG